MKKLELTLGSGDSSIHELNSTFFRRGEKNILNSSNLTKNNSNNSQIITEENCNYLKTGREVPENLTSGIKFDNRMIKNKRNINIEITNYYDEKENMDTNIMHLNTSKKPKSLKFTKNQENSKSGFLPKLSMKTNF